MERQTDLLQVAFALDLSGRFTGFLNGREQQGNEDGNDDQYDQQFNERKCTVCLFHLEAPWMAAFWSGPDHEVNAESTGIILRIG
jgi:hypothetical protein